MIIHILLSIKSITNKNPLNAFMLNLSLPMCTISVQLMPRPVHKKLYSLRTMAECQF